MLKTQIVEALLFASDAPLTAADLARGDESLDEDAVEAAVQALRADYEQTGRSFQIYEVAGGYQILTLPDFAPYLERFDTVPQSGRLSNPGLEVLAIIAYRQSIDRAEIEEIRGVGSSGVLRTLQDRGLIEVAGRGEGLGRPLLYGTTKKFLEHFGFRSMDDLPRPEELPVVLRPRSLRPQLAAAGDPSQLEVELPMALADAELVHLPDTPGPGEIEAVIEAEAAIEEMQASPMEIEAEPAIIEFERTVSGLDTPLALTDPPAEYGAAMETSSGEEEPALDESTTETPQPSRLDAPS